MITKLVHANHELRKQEQEERAAKLVMTARKKELEKVG